MTDRHRPHPRRNQIDERLISRAYADLERVVPEEPVRRQAHPATEDRSGTIVVYLALMLIVILASCVFLATPRPGPSSSPSPSQPGAPRMVTDDVSGAPLAASSPTRYGWATWCAPTPTHCQGWGGDAMVGAVPSFRFGDDRYQAEVCGFEGGSTSCVVVTVVSFCACGDRHGQPTLIDLSPAAFRQLAPTSRGVIRVSVRRIDGATSPRATLPPTDTEAGS